MYRSARQPVAALTLILMVAMAGCSRDEASNAAQDVAQPIVEPIKAVTTSLTDDAAESPQTISVDPLPTPTSNAPQAMGLDIPYPQYPNSSKYRIGGENGLKIVVFETSDTFAAVDEFYRQQDQDNGLLRVQVMSDYVRYSAQDRTSGATSKQHEQTVDPTSDPAATGFPGISIHQFVNVDDAISYGAAPNSKTNIIMSYRSNANQLPLLSVTD